MLTKCIQRKLQLELQGTHVLFVLRREVITSLSGNHSISINFLIIGLVRG